jgi:hypothetical protein
MPVIIAAHAAAPQIRLVIFRYGLLRAGVPFVLRAHTCRHQEAAAASRESEYGYGSKFLESAPGPRTKF